MNPTPSPERPEPPEGYRYLTKKELQGQFPDDTIWATRENAHKLDFWDTCAELGVKSAADLGEGDMDMFYFATRTAPEAVAGERKCESCHGTRKLPAMVETATGLEACPYLAGDDCPDCTPPVEADKDAEKQWRREGRAEAMAILVREDAETFADKFTSESALGDTGDCFIGWNYAELETLLDVDSDKSMVENIEAETWRLRGELMERESDLTTARATIAERDQRIAELAGALDEAVRTLDAKGHHQAAFEVGEIKAKLP